MPQAILVTGGAGYIGSHTVRRLASEGYHPVVLDNLVYGHREALEGTGAGFVEGDIGNDALLDDLFKKHAFAAVVHFAAYAYVGESVTDPLKYYRNNTAAPLALLDAMRRHDCKAFVFSSTCATYGDPETIPITEAEPQTPINPYGQSKLMLEKILEDCDHAHGIRSVKLRYFNACGAAEDGSIGEDHDPETHLIPLVLMAATGERDDIRIFGTDYDTPDGTCIRDYIHVDDLADAHVKALHHLENGGASLGCNIGTGNGVSVREIIAAAEAVTGKTIPVIEEARRPGDPPRLVADASYAKSALGWEAQHTDVTDAIATAWKWMQGPGQGRFKS